MPSVYTHSFNSDVALGGTIPYVGADVVKNEPMLFSCSADAARKLGGPITRSFLDRLELVWDLDEPDVVIDSRVHMLMTGWWPCIPGWHHDDVPRSRSDGQPNYVDPEYRSEHCMALAGADVCPTEFAIGQHALPDVASGRVVYRDWHPMVEDQVRTGRLRLWRAPTWRLIFFDWQSMHQGTQAIGDGWRWFVRASRSTNRQQFNEVRRQVQVYMDRPNDGW